MFLDQANVKRISDDHYSTLCSYTSGEEQVHRTSVLTQARTSSMIGGSPQQIGHRDRSRRILIANLALPLALSSGDRSGLTKTLRILNVLSLVLDARIPRTSLNKSLMDRRYRLLFQTVLEMFLFTGIEAPEAVLYELKTVPNFVVKIRSNSAFTNDFMLLFEMISFYHQTQLEALQRTASLLPESSEGNFSGSDASRKIKVIIIQFVKGIKNVRKQSKLF